MSVSAVARPRCVVEQVECASRGSAAAKASLPGRPACVVIEQRGIELTPAMSRSGINTEGLPHPIRAMACL